jgi:kynurenine formamidase
MGEAGALLQAVSRGGVVDLTHTLTPEFPLGSIYDPVEVADKFTVPTDGFLVRSWAFDEHSGTHVDAPAHFSAEGPTIDRIPVEDLVLPLAVIDVRETVRHDEDALVGPDHVLAWERRHGPLPERGAIVAFTGWGERAPTARYFNEDASGVLHFPGFSPELSAFLDDERPGIRAIGIDAPSLDFGPTTEFPTHSAWLPTGRYGIENLTNVDRLPAVGAVLIAGAAKLLGGSGGPSRILAIVP